MESGRRTGGEESDARTAATLISLWATAVSVLIVTLGLLWRSAAAFVLVTAGWLVLVSPLMVRTARWLGSHDVD